MPGKILRGIRSRILAANTAPPASHRDLIAKSDGWYDIDSAGVAERLAPQSALDAKTDVLIGEIKMWPIATPPAKHLICDGTAVSRTTYADLYAALGGASSPYGQGDGSTTFNLPDYRDRVPVGASASKGLGTTGGRDSVGLLLSNIPSHSHGVGTLAVAGGSHGHADTFAVAAGGTHGHTVGTLVTGINSVDHTHSMNSHTHAPGIHTHDMNNHTHAQAIHSHPMPHNHTINHSHTVNASAVDGAHKGTGRFGEFATREVSTNAFVSGSDTSTSGAESTPNTSNSVAVETGGSGTDRTQGPSANNTAGPSTPNTLGNSADHTHAISGSVATTPDHTHTLTGTVTDSTSHAHTLSGSTANAGQVTPTEIGIQNLYQTLNYIIRAAA